MEYKMWEVERIKSLMIFDFIHILLACYHHRDSYKQTWDNNRQRINLVEKNIEEDKDKIAYAIYEYARAKLAEKKKIENESQEL